MKDADLDTSRSAVKTYVPAYQKDEWRRHAERLEMSQSEFVRTMVQAGRREFEIPSARARAGSTDAADDDSESPADADGELERRVVRLLADGEHLSWEELIDRLTDDIEGRLDETLQRLQTTGRIRYSGRADGYALSGGARGD
ncbi:DUF5805 domain-containing protein [Halegenticoccus tardaugens]|uniref:DUF5805 domain-containing protein n=1 Tax=Halegenticoccus tardaugens TaxID=2071624 RepID=UPI00100AE129|nr:DUF5805 domain-containing protein [Halegenticoccus tardaugens]